MSKVFVILLCKWHRQISNLFRCGDTAFIYLFCQALKQISWQIPRIEKEFTNLDAWFSLLSVRLRVCSIDRIPESVAKYRGSWVEGRGRGSWVWVVSVGVGNCRG